MKYLPLSAILFISLGAATAQARSYEDPNGPYCREFTQKVVIDGVRQTAYGTSCQQPDGSWQIVQTPPEDAPAPNIPPQAVPYTPEYVAVAPPVYYDSYYPRYRPIYYPGYYPAYGSSINIGYSSGHYRGHGYHHGWHH